MSSRFGFSVWLLGVTTFVLGGAMAGALPAVASAQLDPADTISLVAPSGSIYADYPFTFTGVGSVDGADGGDYGVEVLFTPSSSPILRGGCPGDFAATAQAIEQAYGGPDVIASYSALGLTNPVLLGQGAYSWSATVNGDVIKTVTAPGSYVACAYLGDDLTNTTFAVSQPVPFTVTDAPGTGSAPTGFGGPPGTVEPTSRLGLKVAVRRPPLRAPGRNLLAISGTYDATSGPAGLIVTIKAAKRFNGCAANDQQDLQITRADGGAVLTQYEQVTASSAGNFVSPLALNFRKRLSGTAVLCAYLVNGFGDDISVGYLRLSASRKVRASKPHLTSGPHLRQHSPAASGFRVSNGQIIDPTGSTFIARGINTSDVNHAQQILQTFPGINFIRFASPGMPPPSYFRAFITTMTADHVVVEIEHHPWPLIRALSGPKLAAESAWYAGLAATYRNDPYVWFGSLNEPQGGNVTAQQVSTYGAIRSAGSDTIVLLEAGVGAGNPGQAGPGSLVPTAYAGMRNIVFDLHYYGWVTNYSTNQKKVDQTLLGAPGTATGIRSVQQIHSADGIVPVMVAEFGVSTEGSRFDPNRSQDIVAVTQWALAHHYTSGFSGWHWNSDPWNMLQNNGRLTWWGRRLAAAIRAAAAR